MIFELKRDDHSPLYTQIAAQIRAMIGRGALRVGDRLPANRELAKTLGVNRNTVTTAYAELTAEGLLASHVGRGTFVCAQPAGRVPGAEGERAPASPMPWAALLADQKRDTWLRDMLNPRPEKEAISLAYGLPQAEIFPLDEFRRCVDRVLRKDGRALFQLGQSSGYAPLQQYLASQMSLSGIAAKPEEVLVTNGCQQSLDLIQQILVRPGDEVMIESPVYPGAISVFCGPGAKYTSVPVGPAGIDLDVLEDLLAQRRPKLVYTVPTFHNPTGVTMDLQARRRLIGLAAKYRVPIVEDDIYRELRYDGPSCPSLKALDEHGLVIYINSFSKVGFPGLRVGWVTAPRIVIDHLNAVKQRSDLHTSLLAQAAIYEFVRRGLLAKHLNRSRKVYAQQRDVMLAALARHFPDEVTWNKPAGGMAVWVRLPEALNANQVLLQAAERGVTFSPGDQFYACSPHSNMMRLCFTVARPAAIEEGVKRLGAIIRGRLAGLRRQSAVNQAPARRALV